MHADKAHYIMSQSFYGFVMDLDGIANRIIMTLLITLTSLLQPKADPNFNLQVSQM